MKKFFFITLLVNSSCYGIKESDITDIHLIDRKELNDLIMYTTDDFLQKQSIKHDKIWNHRKYSIGDFTTDVLSKTLACLIALVIQKNLISHKPRT